MRRAFEALTLLALAGLLPHAPALARPRSSAPATTGSAAAAEAARPPPVPAPRVIAVEPTGESVEPDQPLVVRFDRDVSPAMRPSLLRLEPALERPVTWPDARTLTLAPASWRVGRPERVRVEVPDGDATEWVFRTRVPAPKGILPGNGARLVLTFDDGPNYLRDADRLLDRLKELQIRARFFPSGRWLAKRPDWVERAVREGHRVCNHTLSHVNLTAPWMTEERIRSEIEGGATDGECRLFRPPLMGYDPRVERIARELGYELYLWDLDSRDWEGGPAVDVLNTVLRGARPEAVVLFHIHARSTYEVLPEMAQRLREAGYVLSWDPADAPDSDVGPSGSGGHREWGAELERRTGSAPDLADGPT